MRGSVSATDGDSKGGYAAGYNAIDSVFMAVSSFPCFYGSILVPYIFLVFRFARRFSLPARKLL